ncbi:MAG: hypothetical protein U0031_18620 [Thermomicrobiales bacterium]
MDGEMVDRLARRIGGASTRRVTLGAFIGGGLLLALGVSGPDVTAKPKRKCKPQSRAKTCANKCGRVKNNCKKPVDCGACAVCQRCSGGICEPDAGQQGDACGEEGQVCLANGTCACRSDPNTCGLGTVCLAGRCQACGFVDGPCCSGNTCVPAAFSVCVAGTCELCGRENEQCCANQTCDAGRVCVVNTNTCERCGDLGQRCCTTGANPCLGGFTCTGGFCVA